MAQRKVSRRRSHADQQRLALGLIMLAVALYAVAIWAATLARTVASALVARPWLLTLAGLGLLACASLSVALWGAARAVRHRRAAARLARLAMLERLCALTPTQFELVVGELLRRSGFSDVEQTGGAGDLAADLICRDRHGALVVAQCKRYAPGYAVTSSQMQMFIGMIYAHHHADYGIFVTTSTFTRPASDLARQHGIRLLNGVALSERLLRLRH